MKDRVLPAVLLLAVMLELFGCRKTLQNDAPMNSFSFSHSGMHTGLIYTLAAEKS